MPASRIITENRYLVTSLSGAQIVVRALEDAGVALTFGIPGTHNIELYDALAESTSVRPVLVTDEQSASFMADAVWRASGQLGCVNVVPGAGLTHAMSGIAEAYMDNVPLLVLGCGIRRDTGMAFQLHDVDQLAMVAPITKAQFRPDSGRGAYTVILEACRVAVEGTPGPVMVEIPANLYLFKHDVELPPRGGERVLLGTPVVPDDTMARAVQLLEGAKRPLIYVGLGARTAEPALVELAERLEAPVASTIQGKGVFPESHALSLWPGFGDAAPSFARRIAQDCDATLAIGCRFGEVATASYGVRPPEPLIHVDISADVLGRNFPTELGVVSDAGTFVRALLPRLRRRSPDEKLRERIRSGHREVASERVAHDDSSRVSPARLLDALQQRFGGDTIFTSDSGNGTFIAMECLRLDGAGKLLAPVDYSCMGYSVPAAIGAKLARPDVPVVALAGDGAFLMTGLELLTAAHESVAIAVFVLRDRELAQIAQFQDVALNRKTCSELPDYDLASICRGVGVECLTLENNAGIGDAIASVERVVRSGRPVVVDVAIDYSQRTYFTQGVVKTNLRRLPWRDRLRFVGRAVGRRILGS
jgi:acetolactate synthase I/II/III large subunit